MYACAHNSTKTDAPNALYVRLTWLVAACIGGTLRAVGHNAVMYIRQARELGSGSDMH